MLQTFRTSLLTRFSARKRSDWPLPPLQPWPQGTSLMTSLPANPMNADAHPVASTRQRSPNSACVPPLPCLLHSLLHRHVRGHIPAVPGKSWQKAHFYKRLFKNVIGPSQPQILLTSEVIHNDLAVRNSSSFVDTISGREGTRSSIGRSGFILKAVEWREGI